MRAPWLVLLALVAVLAALPGAGGLGAGVALAGPVGLPAQEEPGDDDPPEDDEEDEDGPEGDLDLEEYDRLPPDTQWREAIGLPRVAETGAGVTVAVLDTGLNRHPDLGGRVAARVDLTPDGDGSDRYGHGAHMAGILAGDGAASEGRYRGVAPAARVLPVKVAGWNGATDPSAVVGGLEWVLAHRARYGIRVVNLSYGTDSSQSAAVDPLNHAVERLWRAGVVVVVSAGNGGSGARTDKPGDEDEVVAVGAADTRGTSSPADDLVAPFSSRGPTHDGLAKPDLLAPGISIVSHRAPGSLADAGRPAARVGERYFKGTGTSQAAAMVSGVVALMLQANPAMGPDEVKAALVGTANPALRGREGAGAGLVDVRAAVAAAKAGAFRSQEANGGASSASGLGSIDASRGSFKPYTDLDGDGRGEQVSGEIDVLGNPWVARSWASRAWTTSTWAGSPWSPLTAVAGGWGAPSGPAARWAGMGADASTWSQRRWGDAGIDPGAWTQRRWGSSLWN